MKTGYFNSSLIKPLVIASAQHAAFNAGEIVFDWTGFEIPRGTSKLLGGPIPDATPTSLGTAGAEVTNFASTDIVGAMPSAAADSFGLRTLYQSTVSSSELVLEPNGNSGANVGVDKFYVAGLAAGALDFRSALTVNETGFGAAAQTVITTADLDPNLNLIPGDVIHANDDAVLGTILTVDSATQITLTAANTAAIADDDVLYNINPIEIILHFQK